MSMPDSFHYCRTKKVRDHAHEDESEMRFVKKKKKMTRNQIKAQEERRKARKLNWLAFGGPKPEDTDSD